MHLNAFEAESIAGSQSESYLLYLIQVAVGRCYIYILYTFIVDNFDKGLIKVQINLFLTNWKKKLDLGLFLKDLVIILIQGVSLGSPLDCRAW